MIKQITSLLLILTLSLNFAGAADKNLTNAGDVMQILIPLSAFGIATHKQDQEGQKEFFQSFALNTATIFGLKYSLHDTKLDKRPNGGGHSFPSGHAGAAFSGAFFLQKRYGINYGSPAIAMAGFTGYTRTKGRYNHFRDVLGASVIAFGVNHFLVSERESKKQKVKTNLKIKGTTLNLEMSF
jgi:membrane-associated phospholipid phosphatase